MSLKSCEKTGTNEVTLELSISAEAFADAVFHCVACDWFAGNFLSAGSLDLYVPDRNLPCADVVCACIPFPGTYDRDGCLWPCADLYIGYRAEREQQ